MAISKEKKRAIVAKVADALAGASAFVFVGFTKLTVADATKLRALLNQQGVRYFVAKKTLLRRALAERHYAGSLPDLPGEVALAWTEGDDATAPARGVYDFGRKLPAKGGSASSGKGFLMLLGGMLEGALISAERAVAVATVPPLPVVRGMFVNVINSPIQGLVVVLDKVREQKTI